LAKLGEILEGSNLDDPDPPTPSAKDFSSTVEALEEFLSALDGSLDLPVELQSVVVNTRDQLEKAKGMSTDILPELSTLPERFEKYPYMTHGSLNNNTFRRTLRVERNKGTGRQSTTNKNGHFADALGDLRLHQRMSHHFDMHDALLNGDMSYVKNKVQSLGRKLGRAQKKTAPHGRALSLFDDIGDAFGEAFLPSDPDAQKEAVCQQLIEYASAFSVYDLFIFFYSDDIDFETGEADDLIRNFDANGANFLIKRAQVDAAIKEAKRDDIFAHHDQACDSLLEEFHRNVEDGETTQWVGSEVIDVRRAQGTAKFIKFSDLEKAVDVTLRDIIFADLVRCARDIYDMRPNKLTDSESFVFQTSGNVYRFPTSVNSDNLDKHGHIELNADVDTFFKYKSTGKGM
jgi:hypothetical protein